jgi:hypothetical protein
VGGVPYAQQPGPAPTHQAFNADAQQFHVVPGADLTQTLGCEGHEVRDGGAERRQALSTHPVSLALRNDVGALPMPFAADLYEDAPGVEAARCRRGVGALPG